MLNQEEITRENLLRDRIEFRRLLNDCGLVKLAGGHQDAISWLETQIIELADSVSRRQRFIGLLRQTREMLSRGQEESKVLLNAERKERLNPYVEARFRRIKI